MNNLHFIMNVEGVIHRDGKFLMVKRSEEETHAAGMWSMVGGKVEDVTNEDSVLENTLRREILEEVGVEVEDKMRYLMSSSFVADNKNHVVDVVFLCEYKSGEASVKVERELSEVKWLSAEEILNDVSMQEFNKMYIKKAQEILTS